MKACLNKIRSRISHLSRLAPLVLLVLLALFFRLYGLDWDQGQHLHPDERFLTMVLTAIKIPNTFPTYLNPQISPMSPYNNNFSFFVYGTLPLNLTKVIGVLTNNNDYGNIHLVGRILSAVFDVGVVFLLFKIGKRIFDEKVGLMAAFLYSIMVLPIQLSHFFAVDTFLTFFLILSFYFLVLLLTSHPHNPTHNSFLIPTLLGISFGTALACKISALYFAPIIGLGYLYLLLSSRKPFISPKTLILVISFPLFSFFSLLFFRLSQPSAFSSGNFLNWQPNPQFIANLKELKSLSGSDSWYPPSVQWHSTKPIIFPLKNLVLWGLGLPLGIISLAAIIYFLLSLFPPISPKPPKPLKSPQNFVTFLAAVWILGLFLYQGLQFCKSMRYFFPIYPFLALISAVFLTNLNHAICKKFSKRTFYILHFTFYILILVYPISFMSIYSRPITRVTASKWIYENIPNGSTVTYEEWDDGLPLGLPNYPPANFKVESLFMYDFDTMEKWQKLNEKLSRVDYYFITSNRAYGSTMKLPEKYPQTIAFYQSLFNGTGNFKKVAEFTSYPTLPLPFIHSCIFVSPPSMSSRVDRLFGGLIRVDSCEGLKGLVFIDDSSEEAFTVYDHPKVMIFKKTF